MLYRKLVWAAAMVALSIGTCSQPSIADNTSAPMSGGITIDIPNGATRSMLTLSQEAVTMDIFPERCITTARFNIINLSRPTTLDIGFPTKDLGGTDFYKVEGWLNSKGMKSQRKAFAPRWGEVPPHRRGPGWIVWPVHFPFGQTQYIDVAYETKPARATALNYGLGEVEDPKYNRFIEENDLRHIQYVMYSKDIWKGPIGKADVTAKFHRPYTKDNVIIAARHIASDRSKVRWHFENLYDNDKHKLGLNTFEPHAVALDFSATKTLREVTSAARRELENDPLDPYMVSFLGECYATDNRRQDKLNLIANFLSTNTKYLADYARDHNEIVRELTVETFRLADEINSPQTVKQHRYALRTLAKVCLNYEKTHKPVPMTASARTNIWRLENLLEKTDPIRVARYERRRR